MDKNESSRSNKSQKEGVSLADLYKSVTQSYINGEIELVLFLKNQKQEYLIFIGIHSKLFG